MTNYRHGKMIDIIGDMASPKLRVHPERCMLVRNRNANCLHCAEVCPAEAITLNDEGICVHPERCVGCGTCASSCPTGCLEAASPTDEQLFDITQRALALQGHAVAFACEQALGRNAPGEAVGSLHGAINVIGVTCLGRIDESLLVEAVARGAASLQLISGHCAACEHHRGGKLCDDVVQSATSLLASMGAPVPFKRLTVDEVHLVPPTVSPRITSVDDRESPEAPSGEPSFRHRTVPGARTALVPGASKDFTSIFPHVQADGTLPHFVPERRLRLFNSLKALGEAQEAEVATRLWGQVSLNEELCRSCRMCTVFCPTGAIARFDAGDGAFGVEHRSALCMQCRMCETICPEQAITVSDIVNLDEFLSGKKFRFTMLPVGWNPGQEDAIATRMARFMKVDTLQEPQAKVKTGDVARRRSYALDRERRRREIREGEPSDASEA